jgi:DNA-binding GntR family transcriptional regulator
MIAGLLRRVDRYWLAHGLMLKYRAEFEREHRALLAALERHDSERAAALLESHLAGASRLLIAELAAAPEATLPVAEATAAR